MTPFNLPEIYIICTLNAACCLLSVFSPPAMSFSSAQALTLTLTLIITLTLTTTRGEYLFGMHFFTPAHLMKLVEVVVCKVTSSEVLEAAVAVTKRLGQSVSQSVSQSLVIPSNEQTLPTLPYLPYQPPLPTHLITSPFTQARSASWSPTSLASWPIGASSPTS